jgi:hypothetical protein
LLRGVEEISHASNGLDPGCVLRPELCGRETRAVSILEAPPLRL